MKQIFTFLAFCSFCFLNAQVYDDFIGAGHNEGIVVSSSSQESDDQNTINGSGLDHQLIDASRFLSQATLGSNITDIMYAANLGPEAWIDEQMQLTPTSYLDEIETVDDIIYEYYINAGGDPEQYLVSSLHFRFAWSNIIVNAPDVLRHRIALALSEILVISTQSDLNNFGWGLGSYYDILSNNAFGNYKDLLKEVTLSPMMGFYLSHLNNPRTLEELNIHPDENYAREIMQLFTIGLYELNIDGTKKIDGEGKYIPTYDNNEIKELAKVFTGLSVGEWVSPEITQDLQFGAPLFFINTTVPMAMYEEWHEPGPKTIVGGYTIPSGQTGMKDIDDAIDHLFNHENVPPFISRLLIQRLVKSNPTPDYIRRVAEVFVDNGQGERGDLGAVVKAILLDEEARDCWWIDHQSNGMLKEPLIRYTHYIKAFNAETVSGNFWNRGFAHDYFFNQYVLNSPTVFNFFTPDYTPNGDIADANLVAPEFQIFNSATSVGYGNILYYTTILDYLNELPEVFEPLGLTGDYMAQINAPELDDLANFPNSLVDYLDLLLAHGNMSEETRDIIEQSILPLQVEPAYLVRLALYLTMISPDYVIMK